MKPGIKIKIKVDLPKLEPVEQSGLEAAGSQPPVTALFGAYHNNASLFRLTSNRLVSFKNSFQPISPLLVIAMRQLKPSLRRTLHQNVLEFKNSNDQPPPVPVIICSEDQPDEIDLSVFSRNSPLGVAPGYGKDGTLIALGICDGENGLLIEFKPQRIMTEARESVQDLLCNNPSGIYVFDCGTLAMSLYKDLGIRLKDGNDIQSAFPQAGRQPTRVVKEAIGKGQAAKIVENNLAHIFHNPIYDLEDRQRHLNWSQHAWVAQFIVNYYNNRQAFDKVKKINTADLSFNYLEMLAKISTDGKHQP
ncbi:hypothetical protein BJ165DRAFT_1043052 [Panaeolus papilionaceus]|nr:hypothetical protein BJ165DRAFT_1043052 [Panaeolus papilionaceus]